MDIPFYLVDNANETITTTSSTVPRRFIMQLKNIYLYSLFGNHIDCYCGQPVIEFIGGRIAERHTHNKKKCHAEKFLFVFPYASRETWCFSACQVIFFLPDLCFLIVCLSRGCNL